MILHIDDYPLISDLQARFSECFPLLNEAIAKIETIKLPE